MFPLYCIDQLTSTTMTPQLQPSLCTGWGITPPFHWTSTQSVFPWDVLLILKYSLKKRDVVIISLGTTKTLFIHRYILAKFVFTYKAYGQIFKHTTDYWGHTIRNSCHCWMWTWLTSNVWNSSLNIYCIFVAACAESSSSEDAGDGSNWKTVPDFAWMYCERREGIL